MPTQPKKLSFDIELKKKIDIGSGGFKQPGYIGIDILLPHGGNHDIDIVCDIERERWPLEDNSVSHIFSSHCFEHVQANSLVHIFSEMTRVAAHGAKVEIWNPYAFHRDAFVLGHTNYLTEEIYYHICCGQQSAWADRLGGKWFLEEIRYHVDSRVIECLSNIGIEAEIAINHFNNIVKEFGIFAVIEKGHSLGRQLWVFDRVTVDDTTVYGGPPLRETRDTNRRLLSVGQYVPAIASENKLSRVDSVSVVAGNESVKS
jgi:hypothetical protein